jgi:hypothetical protein
MAKKPSNAKAPLNGIDSGKKKPKWYNMQGERKKTGGHVLINDDPSDASSYIHETFNSTGGYRIVEHDKDDKEITHSLSLQKNDYSAGGISHHCDGHFDLNSESTIRQESAGDTAHASGGKRLVAYAKKIEIGGPTTEVKAEGSESVSDFSTSGTRREKHKKDFFIHTEGDHVHMIEKNTIMVSKKEIAINAGENMDTYIGQKGKIESEEEFKLYSGSKIVIKVGKSKITIQDGEIKIEGAKITVKADGEVDIKGAVTKIQGGGMIAPPTTFK